MSEEKKHVLPSQTESAASAAHTSIHNLKQCDFRPLIADLQAAHFPGTREWLFDEVRSWLRASSFPLTSDDSATTTTITATTSRLFWVKGAAGTGKSVVSAKLLETKGVAEYVVAWHFCRHDNAAESSVRVMIESWCAMLSERVEGFAEAAEEEKSNAMSEGGSGGSNGSVEELFEALIGGPLRQVADGDDCDSANSEPMLFVIDALDELPHESLDAVLTLIDTVFESLPLNVKLLVTSRSEHEIETRLQHFKPVMLQVDEIRNRADVRTYLVHVVREHFKLELKTGDIEAELEGRLGMKPGALQGSLSCIERAMQLGQAAHNDAIRDIKDVASFRSVCEVESKVMNAELLLQPEATLGKLYEDAKVAHAKMLAVFASEWEEYNRVDEGKTVLSRAVQGKAVGWVDNVIDPGLKSPDSALRKIDTEYGGNTRRMKDLVRFTLESDNCERLLQVLEAMQTQKEFTVVGLKNKFASPAPLGYRDFNLSIRVEVGGGRSHVCEVQVNLKEMVKAKALAHVYYEEIRRAIPAICKAAGIVGEEEISRFQATVLKMLRRSVLDAAVEQLEAKIGGLFLYATLLVRELQRERGLGLGELSKLRELPSGLEEIYGGYFDRLVGEDGGELGKQRWVKYKRVVSMIVAAREPLPTRIAQEVLGAAEFEHTVQSLSVLFPSTNGRFEVLHKSVVDWLQAASHKYSVSRGDVDVAHEELADILLQLVRKDKRSQIYGTNYSSVPQDISFSLRQVAYHLCAAGRVEEAHKVATNFEWLLARVAIGSPFVLVSDVESVNRVIVNQTTALVASALRLALGALNEDWRYLAGQLVGRLLGHTDVDGVYGLLEEVCRWRGPDEGWWCPIQPTLASAGGNQLVSFSHSDEVNSVQWSPDGKLVCSGSTDGVVRIWSVESGKCVQTFDEHTASVKSISWSPDGKYVCSGSWDDTIRIWPVESEECIKIFDGHTQSVNTVSWSNDSKYVCSGSDDGTARIWSVESGECAQTFNGHTASVKSISWSADGKYVCSSGSDGTVRIWSLESGECIRTLTGHTQAVNTVSWSSDGMYVCSGGYDVTVRIWSVESGACVQIFDGHTECICSVSWSNDSKYVCSGSDDGTARIWSVESAECTQILTGHNQPVSSVSWSSDDKYVCSGGWDKTVRIWSVESGEYAQALTGHTADVMSMSWSGDGKYVCSGSDDETVRIWPVESGECIKIFDGHTQAVNTVSWSNDSKYVCSGSIDGTARIWSVESGECAQTFNGHTADVSSVSWSNDSKYVCSGSWDDTIRIWSVESGECVRIFNGHTLSVNTVSWSNDSKYVCSGSSDETARIWSVESGECVQIFDGHPDDVLTVSWSNDSMYVCSGDNDGTVRIWSLESGECIRTLTIHYQPVSSVSWSNDSKYVCSDSWDKTARIWSVESGECIQICSDRCGGQTALHSNWEIDEQVINGKDPIGFMSQMVYSLSFHGRKGFAQTMFDQVAMHFIQARGGSQSNDGDLDLLMRHRTRNKQLKREQCKPTESKILEQTEQTHRRNIFETEHMIGNAQECDESRSLYSEHNQSMVIENHNEGEGNKVVMAMMDVVKDESAEDTMSELNCGGDISVDEDEETAHNSQNLLQENSDKEHERQVMSAKQEHDETNLMKDKEEDCKDSKLTDKGESELKQVKESKDQKSYVKFIYQRLSLPTRQHTMWILPIVCGLLALWIGKRTFVRQNKVMR